MEPWHHLVGDGLVRELAASSEALADELGGNGTSPHPDAHFAALSIQSAFLHGHTPMRSGECAAYATARPRLFNLLPPVRPASVVITAATRKNSKVCRRPAARAQPVRPSRAQQMLQHGPTCWE